MKKFVLLLVLGILLLPLSAKALAFDAEKSLDENGQCKEVTCTDDGACVSKCTIYLKGNDTLISSLDNVGFKTSDNRVSMTVTSNSTLFESAVKGEVNADGYTLYNFPAKNGGVIDESFLLANVTLTYAKGVDCTLLMSFEGTTITITQEQEQTQEPQPNTGVSLPVVVLIGGAACAVLLYSITNKNKKMYKI